MEKSPDAFRTISEVADHLDTPAHVLRFWESRFPQIRPVKRAGGRRYYRPADVALLSGIRKLLHDEGMTIRGVQKILREQGVRHVAGLVDGDLVLVDDSPEPDRDPVMTQDAAVISLADHPLAMAPPALAPAAAETPEPTLPDHVWFPPDPSEAEPADHLMPDPDDTGPAESFVATEDEAPTELAPAEPLSAELTLPEVAEAEDIWLPALMRAAPRGALAHQADHVGALQSRLAALRDRMAQATRAGRG
jgi:DNA-binding transcriptional MerR regulator